MTVLAASLPLLPATAQTAQPTVPQAGAHCGTLHGTTSAHPTPKRKHMLEQQRARQGGSAAPAGADTAIPALAC